MKRAVHRWKEKGQAFVLLSPFLIIAVSGMAGIVWADRGFAWQGWFAITLLLVGFGVSLRRSSPMGKVLVAAMIATGLLGGLHAIRVAEIEAFPFAKSLADGDSFPVEVTGWIASKPVATGNSTRAIVEFDEISVAGESFRTSHRVPALIRKPDLAVSYGGRFSATGILRPLDGPTVPGGFDARAFYLRHSGSKGQCEISAGDQFELEEGRRGSRFIRFAHRARSSMESALRKGLVDEDMPYAGLIAAMALGARDNAPDDLEELFQLSGTTHLFAVSGMHVGIVGGLFLGVAMLCGVPKRRAIWIVIPLILFYAVLTGLRPSAVRAAVMFTVFLLGFGLKENPRLFNLLGLAAIAILLFDTQQLFLPGFQLSFTVLFFIALFATGLRKLIEAPFRSDPFLPRRLIKPARHSFNAGISWFAAIFAISLTSWIGSAGWLSWHFHSLAPVGIIANLFMVPLAGLIITMAFASLCCAALHIGPLVAFLNQLNVGAAMLLASCAQFFSALPGANHHVGRAEMSGFADVGEVLRIDSMGAFGSAANLIHLPEKRVGGMAPWLIDCGNTQTYRSQLLPHMRFRGMNRIESLMITHGDTAHIGSAPALIAQFRPGILFEAAAENRSPAYATIKRVCESHHVQRVAASRGKRIELGPDLYFDVLYPVTGDRGRLADDRCLVVKLVYDDWSVLFTSDAGFETEKELLETKVNVKADLWIRGQHSEAPSGLPEFVKAVSPKAVISSHADFPANESITETLRELLRERSIPLFDYERGGMVSVFFEGATMKVVPHANPEDEHIFFKN